MNPLDDQLARLFRASGARAPELTPPFGLETRVLAAWRGAAAIDIWSPSVLVKGLLAAFVIMLLSFWPIVSGTTNPAADYMQLADSTVQATMTNP